MAGEANYPAGWDAASKDAGVFDLDTYWRIALGEIPGYSAVSKFGEIKVVGTADPPVDVWAAGGLYTGQPSPFAGTEELIEIVSDDAADDALVGIGAWSMVVIGLDENFDQQEETVTLNGLTAVTTLGTYTRVFRAYIVTTGTGDNNIGTISMTGATSGLLFGTIVPLYDQTQIACYSIPRGKKGILTGLGFQMGRSGGTPGSASVTLRVCSALGGVFRSRRTYEITNSLAAPLLAAPLLLEEYADIRARVDSVSDNGTNVSAQFDIVLIDL